ncbi:MAG: glycosyltransferase [Tepidisphaeraceae bacterium]|jgi:glycosyltransferase involved in cell wall biosynthesis
MDPVTGGPPMIAARFAAAQSALGCDLEIVSYRFPSADARISAALKTIPNFENVKLEYLPPLTKAERFFARGARRRLQPILQRFDLVHLHGVWDPLIFAAAGLSEKLGKPYAVTLHGMLNPWSLGQSRLKKKIALAFGYKRMLNHAAFLHYGNLDERRLTEGLHLTPPAKIVPNGIFLEEFDSLPEKGAFRAEHPELAGAKLVLFLSRLHYQKGLDILADAFAIVARQFPDARLVVAGPDDGARSDFEARIARLGIAPRVHLVGPVYGPEKLAALRDCDCFCLPSRHEGFSIAVLEALACQAPVVITPGCHFPEVKESNSGIIADLDASAIAAGIAAMLGDPAAARQMGQNGRNLVVSRFTWPQLAKELIDNYRQVIPA